MSLRKSTCLTPERLDAARQNARHSTGPCSPAGKQRMRMNALKHGCAAAPENDAAVMLALGEDPKQLEALKQELATAYGPGDPLWIHQLDDLGRLYWQRQRLERMLTGLMREALEKAEEQRRQLARDLASVTFDASQCNAVMLNLPQPTHPLVRLRMRISLLGVILEQVRRRVFTPDQHRQIDSCHKDVLGWRPRRICRLLQLLANLADYKQKHGQTGLSEYVTETFGGEAEMESRYQELVRLLEEENGVVEAAFAEEMAAQERKDEIARDACLAPQGRAAEMVMRQGAALDRSIDRKVRIILAMRKEHAQRQKEAASPPEEESKEREVAPTFRSADAEVKVRATTLRTESPMEEDAPETAESLEQSENVIENKAPATEEVNA